MAHVRLASHSASSAGTSEGDEILSFGRQAPGMLLCMFCARLRHLHGLQCTMLVQPACDSSAGWLEEPTDA